MRLSDAAKAGRGGALPLAAARVAGQGGKAAQTRSEAAPSGKDWPLAVGGAA